MSPDTLQQEEKIMKKCELTDQCPFFNDQLAKVYNAREREELKRKFCGGGGSTQCARYIIAEALGEQQVPNNLFPPDLYKVNLILGMP